MACQEHPLTDILNNGCFEKGWKISLGTSGRESSLVKLIKSSTTKFQKIFQDIILNSNSLKNHLKKCISRHANVLFCMRHLDSPFKSCHASKTCGEKFCARSILVKRRDHYCFFLLLLSSFLFFCKTSDKNKYNFIGIVVSITNLSRCKFWSNLYKMTRSSQLCWKHRLQEIVRVWLWNWKSIKSIFPA